MKFFLDIIDINNFISYMYHRLVLFLSNQTYVRISLTERKKKILRDINMYS